MTWMHKNLQAIGNCGDGVGTSIAGSDAQTCNGPASETVWQDETPASETAGHWSDRRGLSRGPLRVALVGGGDSGLRLAVRQAVEAQSPAWVLDVYSGADEALSGLKRSQANVILLGESAVQLSPAEADAGLTAFFVANPAVVIAKRAIPARVVRSLMAGACGYLLKPVAPADLAGAIANAADAKPVLCEAAQLALLEWFRGVAADPRFAQLTRREWQVLSLWLQGFHGKEISSKLGIAENTVRAHQANLRKEFGVHSRKGIIAKLIHPSHNNC